MEASGLNILITGSSSGFGMLTAKTLAKAGHRVFASMRWADGKNAAARDSLIDWAEREGAALEVVDLDVTDEGLVESAVESVIERAGHIDVLVNNAGIASMGLLEAYSIEEVRRLFEVLAFAPLRLSRAVLPAMRERRSGLIIHISSTAGRLYLPFMGAYSAAKFALEALGEALSYELAPFNIDSVMIEPGAYPTNIMSDVKMPDDGGRLAGYGDIVEKPGELFSAVGSALGAPDAPDPQEVALAVKKLVDTPQGQRPLRTVVGSVAVAGIEEINRTSESSFKKFLDSLG